MGNQSRVFNPFPNNSPSSEPGPWTMGFHSYVGVPTSRAVREHEEHLFFHPLQSTINYFNVSIEISTDTSNYFATNTHLAALSNYIIITLQSSHSQAVENSKPHSSDNQLLQKKSIIYLICTHPWKLKAPLIIQSIISKEINNIFTIIFSHAQWCSSRVKFEVKQRTADAWSTHWMSSTGQFQPSL